MRSGLGLAFAVVDAEIAPGEAAATMPALAFEREPERAKARVDTGDLY